MKLTINEALGLRGALTALDGLIKPVEVNGKTSLITKPYKLAGPVRIKIARNHRILEGTVKDYTTAHDAIVRELSNGGDTVPPEKLPEFQAKENELRQVEREIDLETLTESDLNLEVNEIAPSTVAVLLKYLVPAPASTPTGAPASAEAA